MIIDKWHRNIGTQIKACDTPVEITEKMFMKAEKTIICAEARTIGSMYSTRLKMRSMDCEKENSLWNRMAGLYVSKHIRGLMMNHQYLKVITTKSYMMLQGFIYDHSPYCV